MQKTDNELYGELSSYTLLHPSPEFVHQHIVDAHTAQMADEQTKPISLTFALIGLYLYLEKNYTGQQVQRAHMKMAEHKKLWPKFDIPNDRGNITAESVMKEPEGKTRDLMIRRWCESVWEAYMEIQQQVREIAKKELGV